MRMTKFFLCLFLGLGAIIFGYVLRDLNIPLPIVSAKEKVPDPASRRIVTMKVTAYCPCKKCCGKYADGVTASGYKIQAGDTFVAADKRYPFGTKMIIPGYANNKPVKVLDRGGAIKENRLDVFFNDHQEALKWGVKELPVEILN